MLNWRTPGSPEAVAKALELLLGARRPLILAGGGVVCSEASAQLAAFAEHVNVPVYTSFMGKGALSARHPLHLGIAGCWGEYPAQEAARNADVILALGCRFSDIHSVVVAARLHVQHPADQADPRRHRPAGDRPQLPHRARHRRRRPRGAEAAAARSPSSGARSASGHRWHDQVEAYKEEWSNFIEQEKASDAVPIDPRRVIKELRAAAPDDTLMITDTGNHQTWVEQYWDAYGPQTVFTPGGFAGMGFGTYGVLGLKLARPDQPAVCVTSDGSFMMFPGAVATATEYDIPAVWVILNNYTIGVIRDLQRFYMDGREIGTSFVKHSTGEFWNPDFAKMAESMGAGGITVDQPGDLGSAFETALAAGTPVRDRRQGQPRHGGPAHRHLALRADPAGRADVREAAHPQLSLVPVHRDRRAGAPRAGAPAQRRQPGRRRGAGRGAERHRQVDRRSRPRRAAAGDRRRRRLPLLVRPGDAVPRLPGAGRARRAARAATGGACAIVDLPLNATEDRVAGSVDIGRALREGVMALEPGLLAEANRGILYVDEINLLDDHICDVLLDAAALGANVVEREGVSVSHPARFLLVGTMNPDEGDLRPQLADRIGLRVEVEALGDPGLRAEVIRRREAFTADPATASASGWAEASRRPSRRRLQSARERVVDVSVAPGLYRAIAPARHAGRCREPPRRRDRAAVRQGARRARRRTARSRRDDAARGRGARARPPRRRSTRSSPGPGSTSGCCDASSTTCSTRRRPKKKRRSR